MIYGIFSDVHGNLEALNAVLGLLREKNTAHYLYAGDIVGYGPNPNECVDAIRNLSPLSICAGNHDRAACGLKEVTWFNEYARKAIQWTSKVLTQDHQIYLSELSKTVQLPDFTIVHGSPRDPLDEYLLMRDQYEENIPHLKADITVVGHTHVPLIFGCGPKYALKDSAPVLLEPGKRYILNPGSCGQPRDSNNKASCALFDSENRRLELFRLEYDIIKTQEKMRGFKLPAYLIDRLSWGN